MKIRVISDTHLEFGPLTLQPAGEDLLILAGDIGVHTTAMPWMKETAKKFDIPIVTIAGNHEYYTNPSNRARKERRPPSHTWEGTISDLRQAADQTDKIVKGQVSFFENANAIYDGVRFFGATLWTDMKLFGDDRLVELLIRTKMNDYGSIYHEGGWRIDIDDVVQRHQESREKLTEFLSTPFDGKTVVIAHHAPSWLSIVDEFRDSKISAAYASRLEDLLLTYEPDLFVHGHTHTSFDYQIGETRVLCNPRGYARYQENPDFDPNLIVEI